MYAIRIVPTFFLLALSANVVSGQTGEDLISLSLEEILNIPVESVSRTQKPLLDHTVTARVVTDEQIRERGYVDLLDVLRDMPGTHVIDMANSEHAASSVIVRGIDANTKVLFLLDGEDMSPSTGEPLTFLRNIPLVSVAQIEISYGAASSLYGADALGGIVNVVTYDGTSKQGRESEVWLGAGTDQTYEGQFHRQIDLGEKAVLTLTGGLYTSSQEDLSDAYPKVFGNFDVDPKLESRNLRARFQMGTISASYHHLAGSRNNALGFKPELYDYSGASTWDTEHDRWNLKWAWLSEGPWTGSTSAAYSHYELLPTSSYTFDFSGSQEFDIHSYYWDGKATQIEQSFAWTGNSLTWLTGGEFGRYESIPKTDIGFPLGEYNIDYNNLGAFSQIEAQAREWLGVTAGLRVDHDSRFDSRWNPRLGALIRIRPGLRAHANWGTAYLAPSPHKVYERWGVVEEGGFVHLPNPDLEPEQTSTIDFGMNWFPTRRTHLEFSAFHTKAEDLMRIAFKGAVEIDGVNLLYQTNDNVAESTIYGFSLGSDYELSPELSLSAVYSFTGGTQSAIDLTGEVDLNTMPRHLYNVDATWRGKSSIVHLVGRGFDRTTSNEANQGLAGSHISGAWTADLFAERHISSAGPGFRLGLDVRNVFDKSYVKLEKSDEFFFALPTIPQPRRSISITLRTDW